MDDAVIVGPGDRCARPAAYVTRASGPAAWSEATLGSVAGEG
jgi:hypothetical protein